MVLTMAAVAASKGIAVEKLGARVETAIDDSDHGWQSRFDVKIDLGSGLGKRERIILFNSARRCEVHKLLSGEIGFAYDLSGDG
jgi:uncharacterized OsmC-like protein